MTPPGWPAAFALTLLLETPVYAPALWRSFGPRTPLVILLLNAVTHPVVWFVFPYSTPWWTGFAAAELFAWLVEAALLAALGKARFSREPIPAGRAVLLALSANALSAGAGLLLLG